MKSEPENNFSLEGQRLYPFLKLTRESFPRLLATRKIAPGDDAEYFGPFLPETGVRLLIDFLNKTFRLRTCEIEIDGSFNVPCTQFYRRRCVAPCIESLCDEKSYEEKVMLVRLFLTNQTQALEEKYLKKIEAAAENLDFESAAALRDEWLTIERVLSAKDWNFRLERSVDTFEIAETENEYYVYLVTLRGRKTIGRRTFVFTKTGAKHEILPAILPQIYRFHAPEKIRVSLDFTNRRQIEEELSRRFGRRIKIIPFTDDAPKITAGRALERTKYEHEMRLIGRRKSFDEIRSELKKIFNLRKKPVKLESFDVAHISGKHYVAAKAVWKNGVFLGKEYEFWFSDEESELETLGKFIERRFSGNAGSFPDAVLIDGGKSHLRAALKGLQNMRGRNFALLGAVKPPAQHGEIAYFLSENEMTIDFDGQNDAHRLLQTLRDEAHNLSNEIHRQRREMTHFYELAAALPALDESARRQLLKSAGSLKNILELSENDLLKNFSKEQASVIFRDLQDYRSDRAPVIEPLIIPLRYDDENGDAQDLRPITSYQI